MKTSLLKPLFIFLFIITVSNTFGQKTLSKKPNVQTSKTSNSRSINSKFSSTTVLFLNDKNAYSKTGSIKKNGTDYINTVLLLNEGCFIEDISNLPILINTGNKSIITALVPINSFDLVADNDCIKHMDIGVPFESSLDEARNLTNTDIVHQGLGLNSSYDGSGVIVGIIDVGFDFSHPTFRDDQGNSRVSRVWIQGDNTGTNPVGYNYGSEYIGGTQILSKQRDMDNESHGTHVAGIAAGSGIDGGNDDFKGIAYNSEIMLVSYNLTIEQQGSNNNTNIIDALNYLVNYANSVNKPLVINMSFGTHFGPHDGSSILDHQIDNLVDQGIIIVGAAGNEGEKKIHTTSDFTNNESKFYFIENNGNITTIIDVWGNINTDFNFSFNIYNTITDQWVDTLPSFINTGVSLQDQETLTDAIDNDQWSISYIVTNEPNNKPRAIITIDYSGDLVLNDGDIFTLEINAENTSINAWCISPNFTSVFENYNYTNVIDGDTNITLREIGGTANEIITVGAYTSKNNYTDFLGINHDANSFTEIGEIAPFSSRGPTVDGRMKPDITAPGNTIISSVSSFDTNFLDSSPTVVKGVTDGSQEWWYATLEGTSMAAPVVTGIIALWLEAKPDLTVSDIKSILDNTAIQDSYTGNTNNNIWGRGKIDAWLAMFLIEQSLSVDTNDIIEKMIIYPNPTSDVVLILTAENYTDLKLYNSLGQQVIKLIKKKIEGGLSLDLSELNSGVYYLQVMDNNRIKNAKIIKN